MNSIYLKKNDDDPFVYKITDAPNFNMSNRINILYIKAK